MQIVNFNMWYFIHYSSKSELLALANTMTGKEDKIVQGDREIKKNELSVTKGEIAKLKEASKNKATR